VWQVAAAPKDDGSNQRVIEELQTAVDRLGLNVTKQVVASIRRNAV